MSYEYMTGLGTNGDIDNPDMDFATPEDLVSAGMGLRPMPPELQGGRESSGDTSIYSGIANLFSGLAQQFASNTATEVTGSSTGAPGGKQPSGATPTGAAPAPSGKGAPTTTTPAPAQSTTASADEGEAASEETPSPTSTAAPLVVQPQRSYVPYIVIGGLVLTFGIVGIWLLTRKKD